MRKITALILAATLLLNFTVMANAEEGDTPVTEEIIEEYTNTRTAFASLSISSNGTATIHISCTGLSGTTHISSITYLEKWAGSFWVRVSINGENQISDSANGGYLSRTYTAAVWSGQYRTTTVFTVTRGSNETVKVQSNTATH